MTREEFAKRWGYQTAGGYGQALFDCREKLLKDLDEVLQNIVVKLYDSMTKEEIENNCKKIREDMDLEIPNADIDGYVGKLARLSSLIGLSAECIKFAKRNLLLKQMEVLKVNKNAGLSPSVLSKTIDSESWAEHGQYEYCDRINAGLVHELDALRSIISLHKSEMEQSKWQK